MQLCGQLRPPPLQRASSTASTTRGRPAQLCTGAWTDTARRRRGSATIMAAYSTEALQSIRSAKAEASRQGHLFAGPEHLLIALLDQPSAASRLLHSFNLDADSARFTIDKGQAVPVVGISSALDMDFAPSTKSVLQRVTAAAEAAGRDCTSTLHLLQGLLAPPVAAAVVGILAAAKADAAAIQAQVQKAAASETETPGQQPPDAKAQAEAIVQKYRQELAAQGGQPPPPSLGQTWTAADEDTYN